MKIAEMREKADDVMLFLARFILVVGEWLFAIVGFFVAGVGVVAVIAIMLGANEAAGELAAKFPEFAPWQLAGCVLIILGLVSIIVLMLWQFVRRLREILDTIKGDPFVRANAVRLREMAWIMVLVYIPGFLVVGFGYWLSTMTKEVEFDPGMSLDVGQIVLILLLFILSRVFERGADMREELEGTV